MKVVFATLYDQTCPGARYIISSLMAQGHDVSLLHFKRQRTEFIPRHEEPFSEELKQNYRYLYVAKPEGNYYYPFPTLVTDEERELFVDWIEESGADVVAFTLLSVFSSLGADLSVRLRRRLPQVKIVWGGVHVWFNPEESLRYADVACVGEGEHPMIEFCADTSRTDIENLWFKVDGRIVRNPKRKLYQELDELPFASFGHNEFLVENNQVRAVQPDDDRAFYADSYYIATQRGCPYTCSYCSHSEMRQVYRKQKYVRRRSHEHVFTELDIQTRRFDLETVRFLDDVFLLDPRWIDEFCDQYPSRVGLPWGCYIYPTGGVEKMLEVGAKAGLTYVNVGVQSGSKYVMAELFGRNYELENMVKMCHKAKDLGILLVYDVICFNPYENEGHMVETLDFLMRLPASHEMNTFRLNFFPGVKIEYLDKPKYDLPEKLRLFYALLYHATRHPGLTPEMIREMAVNPAYREDPEKLGELLAVLIKDTQKLWFLEQKSKQLEQAFAHQSAGGNGDNGRRVFGKLRAAVDWLTRVKTEKPSQHPTMPSPIETAGLSMPARQN